MYTQATAPQKLYETSSVQKTLLGALLIDDFGRQWRYAKVGAVAVPGGTVCQGPAALTNVWGRASTAGTQYGEGVVAGATHMSLNNTSGSVAAGDFDGGLYAHHSAGTGFCIPVSTNLAKSQPSANLVQMTLAIGMPHSYTVGAARSGASQNIHNGVVAATAGVSRALVGVAQRDLAAGDYAWLLQKGLGIAIRDGALAEGQPVMCSDGTAGAVETWKVSVTVTGDPETVVVVPDMPIGRCAEYTSGFTTAALINFNIF